MAARRLLIVMLVMLGISTLAAALVPPQQSREGEGTTETSPETTPTDTVPEEPRGRLFRAAINTSDDRVEVIPLRTGDQLELAVRSRRRDQVELPAFGLIAAVGPDGPALFDVLAEKPGEYAIRLVEADRVVGRIEVRNPTGKKRDAKKGAARESD
jgi:hypothetical protein